MPRDSTHCKEVGLPGNTSIYSPATSSDEEIITSAMTPSNHQAELCPVEKVPRRGDLGL